METGIQFLVENTLKIAYSRPSFFQKIFNCHVVLSFVAHIKHIKAKALRTINILQYISDPSTGCNRKIHCLPPIASHIPAWLIPTPNTNLELTEFPKASTLPTVYQTPFSEIVNRIPEAILCFTDGSNQNGRID